MGVRLPAVTSPHTVVFDETTDQVITYANLLGERVPRRARDKKTVFVAYPYSLPADDYRKPFSELGKAFNVKFVFADEEITNSQILDKITGMIRGSRFSLFDITDWNPNVALELGVAVGLQKDYYLLFNPQGEKQNVPSDLGGIDRLQYTTYTQLETVLSRLLIQQFGVPAKDEDKARDQLDALTDAVKNALSGGGLTVAELTNRLQVPKGLIQAVVRPMVEEGALETRGKTRGTRYYLAEDAPTS